MKICQQAGASIVEAARVLKATRRPTVSKTLNEVRAEFLASKATRAKRTRESLSDGTKLFADHIPLGASEGLAAGHGDRNRTRRFCDLGRGVPRELGG